MQMIQDFGKIFLIPPTLPSRLKKKIWLINPINDGGNYKSVASWDTLVAAVKITEVFLIFLWTTKCKPFEQAESTAFKLFL